MITNETVRVLIEVSWAYVRADRPMPDHLLADLEEAARGDHIAVPLRSDVRRLIMMANRGAA